MIKCLIHRLVTIIITSYTTSFYLSSNNHTIVRLNWLISLHALNFQYVPLNQPGKDQEQQHED